MTLTSYVMVPYGPWQRRIIDKAPGMMSGVTEIKVIVVPVANGMAPLPEVAQPMLLRRNCCPAFVATEIRPLRQHRRFDCKRERDGDME